MIEWVMYYQFTYTGPNKAVYESNIAIERTTYKTESACMQGLKDLVKMTPKGHPYRTAGKLTCKSRVVS